MAAISGKGGTVLYGGVSVARISSWSLDIDTNMLDVTSFTTSAPVWREFTPGLNNASGSLSAYWDAGGGSTSQRDMQNNILTPTTATLALEVDQAAGGTYSMTCYLSRQSVNVDIDGTADVSWDVQGTGAVTFSTTT